MCGRFAQISSAAKIAQEFAIAGNGEEAAANYNLLPGKSAYVFLNEKDKTLKRFKWGYALKPKAGTQPKLLINARSETVFEKRMFRDDIRTRRCVIPADGFFEWRQEAGGKTPFFIRLKSQRLMPLAGIWRFASSGENVFSILTTEPNRLMRSIHQRMPVILERANVEDWLAERIHHDFFEHLRRPYPDEQMEAYPVSKYVNDPEKNSKKCIEKLRMIHN